MICDRAYVVADQYGILDWFAANNPIGKKMALFGFAGALGIVYVPKIFVMRAMVQAMKAAQAPPSPMNAADMMHPQPGANDTDTPNPGVYRYG